MTPACGEASDGEAMSWGKGVGDIAPPQVLSGFKIEYEKDSEAIIWAQRGAKENPGTIFTVLTPQAALRYCIDIFGQLRSQVNRYENEASHGL